MIFRNLQTGMMSYIQDQIEAIELHTEDPGLDFNTLTVTPADLVTDLEFVLNDYELRIICHADGTIANDTYNYALALDIDNNVLFMLNNINFEKISTNQTLILKYSIKGAENMLLETIFNTYPQTITYIEESGQSYERSIEYDLSGFYSDMSYTIEKKYNFDKGITPASRLWGYKSESNFYGNKYYQLTYNSEGLITSSTEITQSEYEA